MKDQEALPVISIVLPVYNGERYVSQAIESCLAQTYKNFELILVDDKSTDNSLSIMQHWAAKDPRIKIIRNEINKKLPGSLNTGFAQARGEYYTWTSDDNILRRDFLDTLLAGMRENAADIVYSDYVAIGERGESIETCRMSAPEELPFGGGIGASFLYRKTVDTTLQGYNTSLFLLEDYDFWVRAYLSGFQFLHLTDTPYEYRRHSASLTESKKHQIAKATIVYRYALRKKIHTDKETSVALRLNLLTQGRSLLSFPQKTLLICEILLKKPKTLRTFLAAFKRYTIKKVKKDTHAMKVVHVSASFYPAAASGRLIMAERSIGIDAIGLANHFGKVQFPHYKNALTMGQVVVYTMLRIVKKIWRTMYEIRWQGNERLSPKRKVDFTWNDGVFGEPIHHTIADLQTDITHLHWIASGFPALQYLYKIDTPIVWTLHDVWPLTAGHHCEMGCTPCLTGIGVCTQFNESDSLFSSARYLWLRKKKLYRKIKNLTIITPSQWLGTLVQQSPLFEGREVIVIPNCVDINLFRPMDKVAIRKDLQLPLEKQIILFSAGGGIGVEYKGYTLLAEALHILKEKGQENLHVIVVGSTKEQEVPTLPYPTTFFGFIESEHTLSTIYNSADVFVGPSKQDNFPNVFVETMACGIPGVGFAVGGIPEIALHQERGYIAKPFDTNDLAQGINWVLGDKSRYNRLSENARRFAEDYLAYPVVAEKHRQVYTEIIRCS